MKTLRFLLLAIGSIYALGSCSLAQNDAFKSIGNEELKTMVKQENTVLVDVRTPEELAEGYIPGAVNIVWNGTLDVSTLDTNKTYIIYCRSGGRSKQAASFMCNKGFKNIYNLQKGFMAWDGEVEKP